MSARVDVLPDWVDAGGEQWEVRRAWPRTDGRQTFEGLDSGGRVRAGVWEEGRADVLPFGRDPKLPGLAVPDGGTLLVHRRGRRAVLREEQADGVVFRKVLRPGRADAVASTSSHLTRLADRAGLAAPAVLGLDRDSVLFSALPGRELAAYRGADWAAALTAWSEAWPRLVRSARGQRGLPVHDAGQETAVLRTWVGHLHRHNPLGLDGEALRRTAGRLRTVAAQLEEGTPRPLAVSHRDLHDKQLLFDPLTGRLGVLDFDTAALAEPELDLGNLLAHLELRHEQGTVGAAERDVAREQVRRAAEAVGADAVRLDAYTAASRLRLACVYAFRPPWRELALRWCLQGT